MSQESERSYIAFISYRHKPLDKKAAEMIQKKIENFRVPKEFREKVGGDRLGMVFRDEDELPASSSLSDSITYALDHTKYLLVICTPDLPESKWCEQEIRYFLETHDRDHILAVLVDGEPDVSFSPYLLHTYDENGNITGNTEPLAANIVGPNHTIDKKVFNKEIVRIYAALIGCPFDALWQRQRRARTNRLLAMSGIVMAAMAVFLGVVLSKNAQIARQNTALQKQMSTIYVDTGRSQLENYDVKGALQSGMKALLGDPAGNLYDHRVEKLLADATYAYQGPSRHSRLLYSQPTAIEMLALTPDGKTAVFSDEVHTIRAIDTESGSLLWENAAESERKSSDYSPAEVFAYQNLIVCKYADLIIARRPQDGSEIWRYEYQLADGNHFRAFNKDGSKMMLLDQDDAENSPVYMIILDTDSGNEIGRTAISANNDTISLSAMNPSYKFAGAFSDNDKYGAVAIYVTHKKADGSDAGEEGTLKMAVYNLEHFYEVYSRYFDEPSNISTMIYGVSVSNKKDLLCARYAGSLESLVISLIDGKRKTGTQTFVDHSISTDIGTPVELFNKYLHAVPIMIHDQLALVASENRLFVFNLGTEPILTRGLSFSGNVLSCGWIDQSTDEAYTWNATGAEGYFDINPDGTMDIYGVKKCDQKDIKLLCPFYAQDHTFQFCISVMNSHPGNILIMENTSDPSGELLIESSDNNAGRYYQVAVSPSKDTIYIKHKEEDSDQTTVAAYDAKTHTQLSSADFDMGFFDNTIFVLDRESFLMGKKTFRLDGSNDYYLEHMNSSTESQFIDTWIRHLVLTDGKIMSFYDCCAAGSTSYVPVWLDGKMLASCVEAATGISFQDGKVMEAGKNGLIVGYGVHRYLAEDETLVTAEKDGFMVFDVLRQKRAIFDDLHPEAKDRMLAVGNIDPVFASADNLGHISLYNTETSKGENLNANYGISEIKALTFSPDDRYLLIITQSGRLDCYDLTARSYVYSEQPDIFSSFRYAFVEELTCTAGSDGRYLYLKASSTGDSYGLWLSLDQNSWTVAASSDLVYDASEADNHLYKAHGNNLYRYPIHSLDDLAVQAQELINF